MSGYLGLLRVCQVLRTSEAIIGRAVSADGGVVVGGWDLLARWWLFVRFFRRVMRLICRLSDLLTGVCSLVCCGAMGGLGHGPYGLGEVVVLC